MVEARPRHGWQGILLDAWVSALTVALLWPIARPGQLLARDLVFTPRPPLRPESFGMGSSAPRAVPLDAVVALLSMLIGGDLLGRLALLGGLMLAGGAAHRLCRGFGLPARLLAGGLAIWNPFVVERLALGQWALVLAYAALFPIVAVSRQVVVGRRAPWTLGPWLLLAGLTPTGALLGAGVAVALTGAARGRVRVWILAALVQLPWLMPVLLGAAGATTSAEGFAAFAARSERAGGVLLSLLGLGGIWDRGSMPGSRTGALGYASTVLVVVVLLVAWRSRRVDPPARLGSASERELLILPLWIVGLGGLIVAWLPATPWGSSALPGGLSVIPGMGLLRDSQKWLAPFVVLTVLASGVAARHGQQLVTRRWPSARSTVATLIVLLPVVLMPDAGTRVWSTVTPSRTPAAIVSIQGIVDGAPERLVTAPVATYRRFAWSAERLAVYDPASRWFDVPVVTADRLQVGSVSLPGEDPVARAVESAWASADPTSALGALGVRWVLVYLDQPGAEVIETASAPPMTWKAVVTSPEMVLWELPPAQVTESAAPVDLWRQPRVLTVVALDILVAMGLAWGCVTGQRRASTDQDSCADSQ